MLQRSIDIDLEVHRALEQRRRSFAQTENEILREALGLSPVGGKPVAGLPQVSAVATEAAWHWKGLTLPANTELRMTYGGRSWNGTVSGGAWRIEGRMYGSPSDAASSLARTQNGRAVQLNGWLYWQVRRPGDTRWALLDRLRSKRPVRRPRPNDARRQEEASP